MICSLAVVFANLWTTLIPPIKKSYLAKAMSDRVKLGHYMAQGSLNQGLVPLIYGTPFEVPHFIGGRNFMLSPYREELLEHVMMSTSLIY